MNETLASTCVWLIDMRLTSSAVQAPAGVRITWLVPVPFAGTSTVNVQPPTVDPAGVKDKIKAFVSAYNASVDLVRGKLNEKPVANPQNDSDAAQGVLYGDQSLSSVLAQMRQAISDAGLDSLGVTVPGTGAGTSDDALAGKLSFNEAKFDDAWASSQSAVQAKLGSTTTATNVPVASWPFT